MTFRLIGEPPEVCPAAWLRRVANILTDEYPGLPVATAAECAQLAYRSTWLLDPTEAGELFIAAVRAEHGVRRLPRPLLD